MKTLGLKNSTFFIFFYRILFFSTVMGLIVGCSSQRTIVNGLDEKEANEILVYLASKGIDASKVQAASEGGSSGKAAAWNIGVDSAQANEAMALLNQAGLPRRRGQNLLGIFSNVGLVPSGMEQKIRYEAGLAEQIASTIRKIDGVLDADVQLSFPEEDPLNPTATKGKITASVYVKHNGSLDDPNAHLVTRIKRLVAGSINGLDYDNVTVIGDRARFNELTGGILSNTGEEERHYVNVWSIGLAKESLTRFRILFFSFTIVILLLLLALTWLLWKLHPIIKHIGGIKKFFHYHPIYLEDLDMEEISKGAEEKKENITAIKNEKEDEANKGIDET